jgi:hypothetical protein
MLGLLIGEAFEKVRGQGRLVRRPASSAVRKVCRGCERQRALFRRHGVLRWDRYHTLCFRCCRAHVDQLSRAAAHVG